MAACLGAVRIPVPRNHFHLATHTRTRSLQPPVKKRTSSRPLQSTTSITMASQAPWTPQSQP